MIMQFVCITQHKCSITSLTIYTVRKIYSLMVTDMGLSYAAASRLSAFFRRSSGGGLGGGFWGGSLMLSPRRFCVSMWSIGSQCSPWIAAYDAKVHNQKLNLMWILLHTYLEKHRKIVLCNANGECKWMFQRMGIWQTVTSRFFFAFYTFICVSQTKLRNVSFKQWVVK